VRRSILLWPPARDEQALRRLLNSWGELRPLDHGSVIQSRIDLVEDDRSVTISPSFRMNEKDIDVSLVQEALIIKEKRNRRRRSGKIITSIRNVPTDPSAEDPAPSRG